MCCNVEVHLERPSRTGLQRERVLDNLLVRIHLIIEMIGWTGLAPWEFEFPFPGSIISAFLCTLPHPAEHTTIPSSPPPPGVGFGIRKVDI